MPFGDRIRNKGWKLWTPANIPTQAWFDGNDAATILQADAAGRVSQWSDKSGNNKHFLQAVPAAQPTTGVETINSLNALGFDGLAYFLAMGSNPFAPNVIDAAVFVILNIKTRTNSVLFSLTGSSGNANRWQCHCPWGDNTVYFDCGGTTGANRVQYGSGWADNTIVIMDFIGSQTGGVQQIWENGTLKAGDLTGHSVATVGNPTIGAGAGGTEFDVCAIGEAIIINGSVDPLVRQMIEGYLAWKWGLQANLPASALCKNAPPVIPIG